MAYANPRRIRRNACAEAAEEMIYYSHQAREKVKSGDDYGAGYYARKAWHAMRLAGPVEAARASRKAGNIDGTNT